jgi:thioredoxin 2
MDMFIVTCPSCGTGNRIQAENEGKHGRCGKCRAALPPSYSRPQPLTGSNFDGFIESYPGPVLVEFWAPWWPHCVSFAPAVRTIAGKLAGRAAVVQVNTQDNPTLAARFGVRGIPVTMLLKGGRVIDQLEGAQTTDAILAWFRRHAWKPGLRPRRMNRTSTPHFGVKQILYWSD